MKDGKGGPLSVPDLEFLGYSKVEEQSHHDFGFPEHCRVFDATAPAGISSVRHWFIYLLAECTNDELTKVQSALKSDLFKDETCHIVVPNTLSKRPAFKLLKQTVNMPMEVHVFEELMWNKINQVFNEYMDGERARMNDLKMGIPYIEPSISIEDSTDGENIPSPIDHFVNFLSSDSGNGVAVINAEAGVGKTTLAVMVANKLVQQWEQLRVIPILLTGQRTWQDLAQQLQEVSSLWDVLHLALNLEGGKFPLSDEVLFKHIMRQGYIAFIFDGFDELRGVNLSPQDNFAWLGDIADNSSARLMVTARTSFWKREVRNPETPHQVFKLNPFGKKEAREYFKNYFNENDTLHMKATQLYHQLHKIVDGVNDAGFRFVDLPACAAMIADYVEHGGNVLAQNNTDSRRMVREFLSTILNREKERQGIATEVKKIWKVFRDVAIAYSKFDLESLESAGLEEKDRYLIRDHAFLESISGTTDEYRFRHEFLLHYLRASYIVAKLERKGQKFVEEEYKSDLRKLIHTEADGKGHLSDQVAYLVEDKILGQISEAYKFCLSANDKLKSFLFHVVAKTVALRSHESRADRTKEIFNYLGAEGRKISNLFIEGTIADLSLKDWTIQNSSFVDLSIVKCETDNLVFEQCHFTGNLEHANSRFKECKGENGAELVVIQPNDKQNITEEDLRRYLKTALRRFHRNNYRRKIEKVNWKTGETKKIEERFGLFDLMKRMKLVEQQHSNRPVWGIAPSEIGNVRDFIDNDIPKGTVRKIFDQMKSKALA